MRCSLGLIELRFSANDHHVGAPSGSGDEILPSLPFSIRRSADYGPPESIFNLVTIVQQDVNIELSRRRNVDRIKSTSFKEHPDRVGIEEVEMMGGVTAFESSQSAWISTPVPDNVVRMNKSPDPIN